MGRFRFLELFLSPRLRLLEPGEGGFELQQSWLGFEWKRDESVKGILKLGSNDLLRPAVWYQQPATTQFSVVEAWLEGRTGYGDLRAGLLSIPQGFEGTFPEWNSVLPESMARRKGWVMQRDFGFQFRWDSKPWATSMTIHNGETGTNLDRWVWASGHWQYKNSEGAGMLLSASFGHTRPDSTSASVAASRDLFNFNPNVDSKIRYGIVSLFREDRRNLFLVEYGRGDVIQNDVKHPFAWGRADICWNIGGDASLLVRYEGGSPDLQNQSTMTKAMGLGLVLASQDNLQSWTLYGSKNQEEPERTNDEFWLIFRLHSNLLK